LIHEPRGALLDTGLARKLRIHREHLKSSGSTPYPFAFLNQHLFFFFVNRYFFGLRMPPLLQ
jgi:hypothetical protein